MKSTVIGRKGMKALPFTKLINKTKTSSQSDSKETQRGRKTPEDKGTMLKFSNTPNFPVDVNVIIIVSLRDEHMLKRENKVRSCLPTSIAMKHAENGIAPHIVRRPQNLGASSQ